MSRKNLFRCFLAFTICFCFLPTTVFAVKITRTNDIWTGAKNLNYSNDSYHTKQGNGNLSRETRYLVKWETDGDSRVFCVEPTVRFDKDSISGYTKITEEKDFKTLTTKNGHQWNVYPDISYLKQVFSCWNDNDASIIAAQAIVWELVTEERAAITASKILNDNYKPYMHNGNVYGANRSDITSLYELIEKRPKVYDEYKSVLRCAARFSESVSFTNISEVKAASNPKQIDESFTPATETAPATWSKSFLHSTSNKQNKSILKYYEVKSDSSDVKVKINENKTGIKITSNKEILKENAVKITFKYLYKDNGSSKLNTDNTAFYIKSDPSNNKYPFYQTLGKVQLV